MFSLFDQCRELWIGCPLSGHNMPHYSSVILIELRRCESSSLYITLNSFIIYTHTHTHKHTFLCTLKDIINGCRYEVQQYNILKLHNEELNDQYSLPNIVRVVKSRRMRWAGHMARIGEGRGVHRVLVGKPEGKRPLGRPRRR